MLDAAKEALSFAQNRSRHDLEGDRMLTLALVKSIEMSATKIRGAEATGGGRGRGKAAGAGRSRGYFGSLTNRGFRRIPMTPTAAASIPQVQAQVRELVEYVTGPASRAASAY